HTARYSYVFLFCYVFFHRYIRSFPTRRSSDLFTPALVLLWCNYIPETWAGNFERSPYFKKEDIKQYTREMVSRFKKYNPIYLIRDRKSTRLNSSHVSISYAVFCLKKKKHLYTT